MRLDLFEVGRWIVIARRFERIQHVVGIHNAALAGHPGIHGLVRLVPRRRILVLVERRAGHDEEHFQGTVKASRRLGVFAVVPLRVIADGGRNQTAHHPVASGDLDRGRRQRHQRIDHPGPAFTPHPRVHGPHRGTQHKAQVVYLEPLGDQTVLRLYHVSVRVGGELGMEAIGRLRALAVADSVGQDQEIFFGIQCLAGVEELVGEPVGQEPAATARGPVENQNGVCRVSFGIPLELANGTVVNVEFRQFFTGREWEVGNPEIALHRRGVGQLQGENGDRRNHG